VRQKRPSQKLVAEIRRLYAQAEHTHGNGRFAKAEQFCLRILAIDVRHAQALHLLGIIAYQTGRYEIAVRMIRRAIAVNEVQPFYHSNLGNALQVQGRLDEAVASYERALTINPGYAEAHSNLGIALKAQGKLDEAVTSYERALTINPGYAEAHSNLGNALQVQGKLDEAMACYKRALTINPGYAEAHSNLGNALQVQGKLDEAMACYKRALTINPGYAEAHDNLGNALQAQGKVDEAMACYKRALTINPDYADAHYNLGNALQVQGKAEEAVASYERALTINPGYAEAHSNLGSALQAQGKVDEAMACYKRALTINPGYAEAHSNLGIALKAQGKLDEAVASYERALTINPGYAEARWNLSLTQLLQGDFAVGWRNYESRYFLKWRPRNFPQPLWHGESLNGARILLHAEQGLGDSLQFLRYVPIVQAAGGAVVLDLPEPLFRIAAGMSSDFVLKTSGEPLPPFDWQCPLMSLPLALGTTLETIPATVPYLTVPEEALHSAASRSWPKDGLRVGLVWAGNPTQLNDLNRSVPLSILKPLLDIEGIHFFSLQMGSANVQLAAAQAPIVDLAPAIGDFADTAALIAHLDLVIAVDTSVVHLAGALAKPVWVLLSFASDWRWLLDREDSPWYPTARLFRQSRQGDWQSVIKQVRTQLCDLAKKFAFSR
jgi:tetratricopeptide (TPR) repeat protein